MKKILYILLLIPFLANGSDYFAKSVNGNNADATGSVTISTATDSSVFATKTFLASSIAPKANQQALVDTASAHTTRIDAKTNKLIVANRQTSSYTLVLADADKLVEMNVGSANNLTVPLNSSVAYSIGTQIVLAQYGAGQTTVVATGGVTIRSASGKLKLTGQYSGASLIKIATDEWYLFGDITN